MPFPYLDETMELNENTRRLAGGSFTRLTDGVTYYEIGGSGSDVPIVLLHGFSVPCFIFDRTFEFLRDAGFRVLRYDLFGRGYSDRPHLDYDIHLFVRQLRDLLEFLELRPVHLLGLSMGGPVATTFVERYPDKVERLILIDPAGAKPIALSHLLEAIKMPGLGELIIGLFGSGNMIKNIASDFFEPDLIKIFQEKYRIQMQFKGFKRAILSTLRKDMLGSFHDTYERVGRLRKPTLLLWGRNDRTVPFSDSALILKALPHAEFHVIEDSGHIPHFEKPEVVNPILIEFLNRR